MYHLLVAAYLIQRHTHEAKKPEQVMSVAKGQEVRYIAPREITKSTVGSASGQRHVWLSR